MLITNHCPSRNRYNPSCRCCPNPSRYRPSCRFPNWNRWHTGCSRKVQCRSLRNIRCRCSRCNGLKAHCQHTMQVPMSCCYHRSNTSCPSSSNGYHHMYSSPRVACHAKRKKLSGKTQKIPFKMTFGYILKGIFLSM